MRDREFADSLLEGTGFEPSVPPDRSSGGTYPADNRSDAPTLFSSGARRRLRATRIRSASVDGSGYIVRELSLFPSRSPKETRIHKWDQEFESVSLQRRVSCEPDFLDQGGQFARPSLPASRLSIFKHGRVYSMLP